MKVRRIYKDSLFRDIFRNKSRLAELYEALTGEHADPADIVDTTLRSAVFSSIKNDLSFRVKDKHIILIEHQSSLSENMPLRMLWYIAHLYQKEVRREVVYHEALVPLPTPEFYVFYNGENTKNQCVRCGFRMPSAGGPRRSNSACAYTISTTMLRMRSSRAAGRCTAIVYSSRM